MEVGDKVISSPRRLEVGEVLWLGEGSLAQILYKRDGDLTFRYMYTDRLIVVGKKNENG